jgi:hypothetical protein
MKKQFNWFPKKFVPNKPVEIGPAPKVSIVVTGRNDNYDGNFNERLAIALSKNMLFLPHAEFIFIEWNPILNRPLVCEYLKNLFGDKVKYYAVHPKFHSAYCSIDGFIEYPAKNVGIRRATNPFVLCTNSDVIFSPEVSEAMRSMLKSEIMYRAIRVDLPVDYTDVKFPLPTCMRLSTHKEGLLMNAAGDFLLMHKDMWNKVTGYCEDFPEQRLHKDAYIIHLLSQMGYTYESLGEITHWRHPSSWANGFIRPRVGDVYWKFQDLPWKGNKDTWGLMGTKEVNRGGITWLV